MRRIYLDHHATTPADPRVVDAMRPCFTEAFGNPHSHGHAFGWEASDAVEHARAGVAALIGADPREIVFTSGATESCNLALRGLARRAPAERRKIVTVATEHPAVLDTCAALAEEGLSNVVLPVDRDGLVDPDDVRRAIDGRTLLVSIMLANNEIGVLQPIGDIAAVCRQAGVWLHTDATQAVGRIPVDVRALGIDFLSCSAHKLYGPKGIGALFTRWAAADAVAPSITGGGQERSLRPGTVAVPLAVGFGCACRIASDELGRDRAHATRLADVLLSRLRRRAPDLRIFGHPHRRLPGSLNIGFPGVPGDEIVERVGDRLAVSTGSACASVSAEPSHVLSALDPNGSEATLGVRLCVGRFNDEDDIEEAATLLADAAG